MYTRSQLEVIEEEALWHMIVFLAPRFSDDRDAHIVLEYCEPNSITKPCQSNLYVPQNGIRTLPQYHP